MAVAMNKLFHIMEFEWLKTSTANPADLCGRSRMKWQLISNLLNPAEELLLQLCQNMNEI